MKRRTRLIEAPLLAIAFAMAARQRVKPGAAEKERRTRHPREGGDLVKSRIAQASHMLREVPACAGMTTPADERSYEGALEKVRDAIDEIRKAIEEGRSK